MPAEHFPSYHTEGATTVQHWIGGRLEHDPAQRTQDVFNPATGNVVRRAALGSRDLVDRAVASAADAFPRWSEPPPVRRARVLNRVLTLLNEQHDALAAIITEEHGKVFADDQGEVMRGIEIVEFACGIPHLLKGDFTDQVSNRSISQVSGDPRRTVRNRTAFVSSRYSNGVEEVSKPLPQKVPLRVPGMLSDGLCC
jgi:malonate-semialdehyde dehydrogenase (acetylating)/methylmalonate-semialdehyde dehydrogenase